MGRYGDDEEDCGPFAIGASDQQQQGAKRQKRKRWNCGGPRTTPTTGPRTTHGGPPRTTTAGPQKKTLEEAPNALAASRRELGRRTGQEGGQHAAVEQVGGQHAAVEQVGGQLRRSEEDFFYSSNWESDSSAMLEEGEEREE